MAAKTYRLGVDVGGTHTDLVLLDVADGSLAVEKVATTPANPALGIMRGIEQFAARGVDLSAASNFSRTAPRSPPTRCWKCAAPRSAC